MKNKLQKYSDEKLISILRDNGGLNSSHIDIKECFSVIFKRYSNKIYLYIKKVLGDETLAEDILQDTFIKFLKSLETNIPIHNVLAYLLKIARNLCLNHVRDNSMVFVNLDECTFEFYETVLENEELSQVINTALELLPVEHKEAFILQVYQGCSYNEIADITDSNISTVRNRIVRAKRKLREILSEYYETNKDKKNYGK